MSLKIIESTYQYRPKIQKSEKAYIDTDIFLEKKFELISAIWAVDIDGSYAVGNYEPMLVVHNPKAKNPLPIGLIPAHYEYVIRILGDELEITKERGIL